MTAPIDYQAVLADLEAKRAHIDLLISGLRAFMAGGIPDAPEGDAAQLDALPGTVVAQRHVRPSGTLSSTILSDTFFGLSTPEAVRKFLIMSKRPQKVSDIAKGILEGGQVHARDTTTAYNNAYAALKRMRKAGEAVRIKTGEWGLSEWYTNRPKTDGE